MGGQSSRISANNLPVVVIVGGGYGGTAAAKLLDRDFFVVLIDRKNYFSHLIALPRAVVEPSVAGRALMPYTRLLKNGVYVNATVTAVTPTGIQLQGFATPLPFDYLIIALGSSYTLPARIGPSVRADALPLYPSIRASIERTGSVLVVGAGAVGTELAAEVATDFPGRKVTLVNAHSYFGLADLSEKFNSSVLSQLDRLHVDVVTEDRVIVPDDVAAGLVERDLLYLDEKRTFRTVKGRDITADLTFFTTGTRHNSGALVSAFGSILSKKGELPVNDHLQVRGFSHIFALGDISGREATKLAYRAGQQGKWLGKHLLNIHKQRGDVSGVPAYTPPPPAMFLALGRKGGAGQYDKQVFPTFVVKALKSGSMLVDQTRKELRVKKTDVDVSYSHEEMKEKASRLAKALKLSEAEAIQLVSGERRDKPTPVARAEHL